MENLLKDFRFGVRVLRRMPLISVSIVLVLAFGIGANSAMFAVVDGLLLHSVHYPDPQTLAFVWSVNEQDAVSNASPGDYLDWRAKASTVSDLAAWNPTTFVFRGGERPRQLAGARVTANFFRTLRVKPFLGRTFLPDEDGLDHPDNASRVAVISYRLWQEELGADPNVLGRPVNVDTVPYTIVGVMPPDFQFWWRPHDLWIPVTLDRQQRDYRNLAVVARLSAPRARMEAEMNLIARDLSAAYPKSDKGWTIRIENLEERLLNRSFRLRLLLSSAAVGLVLLIACANVTALLLARSAARQQEFAVRISLGATAWRLGRQLLAESALLAIAGGSLGLALAWTLVLGIPRFVPADVIPVGAIELGTGVIVFCIAASALTCLLVGLAPAVSVARSGPGATLKNSSRGATAGRSRQRFQRTLVVGEIATALMLLAGAWLMAGSLNAMTALDLGFNPHDVLTVRIVLPAAKYDGPQGARFFAQARETLAQMPQVEDATLGSTLPLSGDIYVSFERQDAPRDAGHRPRAQYSAIGADYFETLKIPLKRGRLFTEADNEHSKLVALVSEQFAARYFPDRDPIGEPLLISRPTRTQGQEKVTVEIAGVVGDINVTNLLIDARAMIYVPYSQNPFARNVGFAVRSREGTAGLASAIRAAFASLDPEQPVEQMTTLDQLLDQVYAEPRFQTTLMISFAILALLLASIGVYGVNAYAVTQRRNEIGLRMALGASQGAVLRDVLGLGLRLIALGIGVGLIAAAGMTMWLRSLVVGTGKIDPIAFAGAAVVLGAVAILACYLPARRATRIDPAVALRGQ
jgi:putative ABC transport system permease protein